MDYRPAIIRILHKAGPEGLALRELSRHVFNECNSFFEPIEKADVHAFVARFVQTHAQGRSALFRRCKHGVYALMPLTPKLLESLATHYNTVLDGMNESIETNSPNAHNPFSLFTDEDFL